MKAALAAASAFLLAACAAHRPPAPLYTRAALANWTTAELARRFLDPADAATIVRHQIDDHHYLARDRSWDVLFVARDRPVGLDICQRTTFLVDFFPTRRRRADAALSEMPAWAGEVHRFADFALAPGCAELPGRSFADKNGFGDNAISNDDAIAILRTLAAAQAAAAGTGPLPFRLSCLNASRHWEFKCPTELRPLLASLPLHQAFSVERHPFPNNCDRSARDESDAVEVGDPHKGEIWDVRLRDMGRAQASILLIRQYSRTHVKC